MSNLLKRVAHGLLPKSKRPRRLRFGLAKGRVANIDFRLDAGYYFGLHEPDLHVHYRRLLKPGMRVFDVGMYRGWDALNFAVMTGADVVSFDGDSKNLEDTDEFLQASLVPGVKLVKAYLSDGSEGSYTLDQAAADHFEPDFIKMDIEGAEAKALRGASKLLGGRRPKWVIETHGMKVENECVELLEHHGYHVIVIQRSKGPFTEARSLEHNRWLVCEHPQGV